MSGVDRIVRDHGIGVLDSELAARGHKQSEHRISESVLHRTAAIVIETVIDADTTLPAAVLMQCPGPRCLRLAGAAWCAVSQSTVGSVMFRRGVKPAGAVESVAPGRLPGAGERTFALPVCWASGFVSASRRGF